MMTKCSVSDSCFLSSCCQSAEFRNTWPNKFEKVRKGQMINYAAKDNVHIILSGVGLISISVGSEEEMNLALLGKGNVIGILAPFAGEDGLKNRWILSLNALSDMEVCKVSCRGLKHYAKQYPSILYGFILACNAADRSAVRQTWIRSPRKTCDRVMRALVVLKQLHGGELNVSHDELALIVDADRATVTQALHKLRDQGLVDLKYRRIQMKTTLASYESEFALNRESDHLSMLPFLA